MSETVEICVRKRTVCQTSYLIAVQLETGQAPGVSEPGPPQRAEGIVAQHEHLQTAKLAEGVVGERGAGYLVVDSLII